MSNQPNTVAAEFDSTCFIAEGTVIDGEFRTAANVRIDGTIKGDVHCDGKLIMGKKGGVKGNIVAGFGTIEGHFEGDIVTKDTLHLYPTANVTGKFKSSKIIVDEGAVMNGECHFGPDAK